MSAGEVPVRVILSTLAQPPHLRAVGTGHRATRAPLVLTAKGCGGTGEASAAAEPAARRETERPLPPGRSSPGLGPPTSQT